MREGGCESTCNGEDHVQYPPYLAKLAWASWEMRSKAFLSLDGSSALCAPLPKPLDKHADLHEQQRHPNAPCPAGMCGSSAAEAN
eukprot:1160792-Pelagomonas_calceolata.AAC.4